MSDQGNGRRIPLGRRSVTGQNSWGGPPVSSESTLERDFVTIIRFERNVRDIKSQPKTIHYRDGNGKWRPYTADYRVEFHDAQTILVEVKYLAELKEKEDEFKLRFEAASEYARARNWRFEIWTEIQIRKPELTVARFLLPYRDKEFNSGLGARLESKLRKSETLTVNELLEEFKNDKNVRRDASQALRCLLARRKITTDFSVALTGESEVYLA